MYKELLTQTVQNAFLWYKKLSIINIWYCWIIIGPIRSNIPATSFYVWQSWQYIFLESRDVSYAFFVLCLWQIVLFLLLPSINHYPCDQLWDCADVLGQQNLSTASNVIFTLYLFPLRPWEHSQYVLLLVSSLFLI